MEFSEDEWQKMQAVYEEQWALKQSPIQVIRELRAKFEFSLAEAKYVFDKLHFREKYEERQNQINAMWDAAEILAAEGETAN